MKATFFQATDEHSGQIFRAVYMNKMQPKDERRLAAWMVGRSYITTKRKKGASFPGLTMHEFKQELRIEDYKGDRWAVAMGAFFDLCAVLWCVGDVPAEWEYRPGVVSDLDADESWFVELFKQCTVEQLTEIGWFLHRLTGFLRNSEHAY